MASNQNGSVGLKIDLAREPMPKLKDKGSEQEEEEAIGAHLMYMNKVLEAIKDREEQLSGEAKKQVSEFRVNWKNFFGPEGKERDVEATTCTDQGNSYKRTNASKFQSDESSISGEDGRKRTKIGSRKGNSRGHPIRTQGVVKKNGSRSKKSKPIKYESSGHSSELSVSSSSSSLRRDSRSSDSSKNESYDSANDNRSGSSRSGRKNKSFFELMKNIDNRKVPMQERFDEQSGQDLKKYIDKFEDYCRCNYRGSRTLWIGELERSLSGKTLEAFRALRAVDDSYRSMKEKLLNWYDNSKEVRRKKNKKRFKNAGYSSGDSFYLFAVKLESLYKLAYPKHKVSHSQTLREKYLSAIPKSFRRELKSQLSTFRLQDRKVPWAMVKKCANLKDLEGENDSEQETVATKGSDREIVINVGQANSYRESRIAEDQRKPVYVRQFRNSNTRYHLGQLDNRSDRVGEEYHRERPSIPRWRIGRGDSQSGSSRGNPDRGTTGQSILYSSDYRNASRISGGVPASLKTLSARCNYCNRIGHLE